MNKDNDLKKLRAIKFREINGDVLRRINLLRDKYMDIKDVESLVCVNGNVTKRDVSDSVNFLEIEGYITLRDKYTKIDTKLADSDINDLEARLTGRGIRLVNGAIKDDLVVI